jgi:hypothetical protein
MRKPVGAVLFTLTSAALAFGLTATSSFAAITRATWTVKPGGAITGAAGTTKVTDTTSGLTVTCTSSSLTGTLKSGSGLSGSGIGTITALNFTNCSVDGITLSLASGPVTYAINASSYKSGVTHGTISKIHFVISSSECNAVIDGTSGTAHNGSVKFTYTNKTATLKLLTTGIKLHVWYVKGCLGAIANGDSGNISASYKLTPAQTITSP